MALLRPQFRTPPSFDRCTPPRRRFNHNILPSVVLLHQCQCRNRHRGKLQDLSPPPVLFESSRIFYNTQETQTEKMMDQNFEIRIVIFDNFLKFSKRRRVVPLQPIWTFMLAAKLDQSRVLVTKFRQNRLTMKGRSAGQRHTDRQTDRQTNSAENNGPSGLQSGQQTLDHSIYCTMQMSRSVPKTKFTKATI